MMRVRYRDLSIAYQGSRKTRSYIVRIKGTESQAIGNSTLDCGRSALPRTRDLKRDMPVATLRADIFETNLVPLINEQWGEEGEGRDEREFSQCCSFSWRFGCRGTNRRLGTKKFGNSDGTGRDLSKGGR